MKLKKQFSSFFAVICALSVLIFLFPSFLQTVSAEEGYPIQRFYMGIYNTNRNVNSSDTLLKSDVQNGTNSEEWSLNYVSSDVFEIVNSANNYVLTSSGSEVSLARDTDDSSQRWKIEGVQKDFDGYYLYYKIVSNEDASKALTFSADSNSFYLNSYTGNNYQKFKINLAGLEGFAANCMVSEGEKAGTIGGLFGKNVTVSNDADLIKYLNSPEPYTIIINGTIDMSSHQKTRIRDNKTIVGTYGGAVLQDCELRTNNEYGTQGDEPSDNIVFQNIDFLAKKERGRILIQIWSSRQIWIDHCTFNSQLSRDVNEVGKFIWINTPYENYMDNKDRGRSPDYITISYDVFRNRFWTVAYGTQNDEITRCRTTLMYNWWDQCVRRCPQIGNGNGHVYNNYYSGNDSGNDQSTFQIIGGAGCDIVSENCRFQSVKGYEIVAGGGGEPYRDSGSYTSDKSNSTPYKLTFEAKNTSTWYPDKTNYGYSLMDAYNTNGTDTKDFCTTFAGCKSSESALKFITDSDMSKYITTKHSSPFLKNITVSEQKKAAVMDTSVNYMFQNAGSGLYMEVENGNASNGANVQQWGAYTNAPHNTWKLLDAGEGYYYICSCVGDGKTYFLDLCYGKSDNGTNIGIWTNDNSDARKFKFFDNKDGTYTILTKSSKDASCIGVESDSLQHGANILQWECNGSDSQKWKLIKIAENEVNDITDSVFKITISKQSYTYTGSAIKPKVSVKKGDTVLMLNKDYAVRYVNNVNAGTASVIIAGRGNYTGKVTKTFTITEAAGDISKCDIIIPKSSYIYTGKAVKPKVTVKNGNEVLTINTDYAIRYADNINIGTASIIIVGRGNYAGSAIKTFNIINTSTDINKCTVTMPRTSYSYTGKAVKPKITVKNGDKILMVNTDYAVRYINNVNKGTASVIIAGKGAYSGKITKTFRIV